MPGGVGVGPELPVAIDWIDGWTDRWPYVCYPINKWVSG